jgi:HIV Tat-specific factor 1
MLDIKEDVREECAKLGDVTNVVLYDKEQDGVATVRFSDPIAARACVEVMNGRFFDQQQVIAYIADGSERFKKTNAKKVDIEEDEDESADNDVEESRRLDKFGNWLEEGANEAEVDDQT